MAVSEVKIAKNRDQNREEDENSRPGKIRSEIRSTGPVTGQPGVKSGPTGPVTGQPGVKSGPTGPVTGQPAKSGPTGPVTGQPGKIRSNRAVPGSLALNPVNRALEGDIYYDYLDFKQFLRARFQVKSTKLDNAVVCSNTTVKEIVPLPTVTKVEVKSSEERKPGSDTKSATVTVEEDVPLSGLNMQLKRVQGDACKTVDKVQRWSLFQTQCIIKGKACKLMIDGGSCTNGISKAMVAALGLSTWRLPEPKRLEWLNSCGMLKITHKVRVPFTVDDYVDEIDCDVLPLEVCGLLLGRPWQYDRNVTHAGRANTYSFMHGGKQRTLKPMGDDHIKSDVELVVRKEKLHKPKVQQEVHDVPSIDVGDVSAMPVDDKPVLVGDKPDEATLVVDVDVAACATVPVCVDASMQTDDVCADDVPVHMAQMRVGGVGGERVSGDSGQRHYRARSTVQFSATPRMHRGKDGRVRHLCGPGITHLVQGHVQRHRGPSKPRKKKELAPKSKLIWRRKEAPSAVSSREGREGGCGVEGKQDLKTARTCHVHITSPFPEDPHALGTTLLEGGRMIRAWRPMWSPDSGLHQLIYPSLCISMDEVRKKLFVMSLSGKAAHWYKLLKDGRSLDWKDIVPLFYSKFYPPSEIHKDRNRIYNFWPHDGESIAQAWGRLKSLMLKCPIHELPGNIIIDNFYARLSFQDKTLLDTSCSGSFTRNKEEFKWDLLDRIQENTEGWENDKGRVSGINYNYECIETFMDTDEYRNISATYGLDSQVVANIYKAFASHFELPRKNFDKYHEPYKDKVDSLKGKCIEIKTVDHVLPEAYIEKTPFPAKMKEYSVITSAVNKSAKKPIEPEEQIKVEPAVAIVKDLVTENVEDGHIIFCEDASNIVSHPNKSRKASVPVLSVRIGDHCYYGLCDIGASISVIPYELYTEIMHEIGSCELEDIDVVIRLANRETISPIGIVRDVEVLCGKIKYPADFLVLGSAASKSCPIIFGRPFLNTCGAIIDCKKEKIVTKFAGESYEFNFSKFAKTPYKADLPNDDFRVEQCASIALAPSNPLQQHLENSESEVFREERDELDEIFLRQPILKHDLPVEDLGVTPPPKEDPVFDLKPLPDNLKYAYIDDKKTYHVIISAKLSDIEEERLLEILKKHRGAIGYTLDDLKGISPAICQHAINIEDGAKPVVEHQRRLIPKMKDVVRNEVLKLLEAGIIYPIADSRWVSPVHCVPKKGGITVVPNDNDELIPQRVVVGYRMCIDFRKVNKIVEVFMDDFSVYGNSFDNCLRNLDKVLQRCEETNLVLNWEKCHFMVNEGIVLGHKISERGIEVDRAKVEAIEKMPYPRDVKGIRSILGHAGFYRRFIKDFSKISKPLTNLLQKDVPFVFDDDCKEAFETLKKALTTAPVVEPPDWNLPFEIMCDASDFAVGAVLGQRVDKKLNKDAKPRLIRWVLLLQEFDLHIVDRKGADNPVADNLSRLENIAYDPVPVNDSFPNEQLAVIKDITPEIEPHKRSRATMSSSEPPKDNFFENVVNPYISELKMHPKELLLVDGELQIEDVRGPKGEGSLEDRMEKLEQEVFTYKKMAEREVDIFHRIVSELIGEHEKETAKLWSDILSLHNTTNQLQAQLYDAWNQNCEYENRFKRISDAASFRIPETKTSFVDGEPLPWKSDDEKNPPPSPPKE
ncbi:hypothetical protein QYE76_033522 [Lolium multiflorum]|uniref:Uncharacterized protein n=1 Tax=Lolium multiflorum TaxID=4521 RepID=A0AAD8QXR3_LOLMU|nr:hypothetical protein QYE76_033522 [Lolium multiflorum]